MYSLFALRRDPGGHFTGGHGIASHRILESGRREDDRQADRFDANVLQTYPGVSRNKHKSPRMDISLLIAQPNASLPALDQQYFVLGQVLVSGMVAPGASSSVPSTRC